MVAFVEIDPYVLANKVFVFFLSAVWATVRFSAFENQGYRPNG